MTDECFYKRLGRGLLGAPLILVLVIVVYFLLFASFTVGGDTLYHLIVRTRRGSWATSFEVASIQRLIQNMSATMKVLECLFVWRIRTLTESVA